MQITLTTAWGEVISLPEALAIDDEDLRMYEAPSMQIPNRHGRLVVGKRPLRDQRTIRLSGVVRDVDRATLEATVSEINGKLCRDDLQLRRDTASDRYLWVRTTGIQVNPNRGHFGGRVATISCTLVADDPFWHTAEQTIEHLVSGTPGQIVRVEAEAPGAHRVVLGNTMAAENGWVPVSNASTSGGAAFRTATVNDYYDIAFYGVGISIIGTKFAQAGVGEVSVDGVVHGTFDQFAANAVYQQVLYSAVGLVPGQHVCRIGMTGTKNPSSGGTEISLDAFDIIGSSVLTIDNPGTAEADPEIYIQAVEQETSADFLGKTAGSVAANKHIAKAADAPALPAPSDGAWAEVNQAGYDAMAKRGGSSHSKTTSVATRYPGILVSKNLSHICGGNVDLVRANLTAMDIEALLDAVGMNGSAKDWQSELLLFNRNTSQWDSQGYAGMQFSRASTAYRLRDGAQVAANVPRFELGYFHNLLTANQSSVETDLTGIVPIGSGSTVEPTGVTLTRDTTEHYDGAAAAKVVTDGSKAYQGLAAPSLTARLYVSPSTVYAVRARVKGTAGTNIIIQGNGDAANYTRAAFTLTGGWDDITYEFTTAATESRLCLAVYASGTVATTFYVDCMQIQKNRLAGWVLGGTGRALLSEEGATNLVPVDRQIFVGWLAHSGAVITLTQNQAVPEWNAVNATKIQSAGGTNVAKTYYSIGAGTNGQAYSASVWVKNQGATTVTLHSNQGGISTTVAPGESKRAKMKNIISNGVGEIQIQFRTANIADSMDIIAWRPQYEQKADCTSFTDTTRAAESLLIPEPVRNGVLNEAEGEISIWAYEDGVVQNAKIIDSTISVSGRLVLYKTATNGRHSVWFNNGERILAGVGLSVGWHLHKLVWKGVYVAYFVDGVKVGENSMPSFATFLGVANFYVGVDYSSGAQYNSWVDSLIIKNHTQADAAAIAAAAAAEYVTCSQQPFAADANTMYLQNFDDSLGGIMPFKKTLAAGLGNYVVDASGVPWVHMLLKPRYPSDGNEQATVYVDYVRLGTKYAYASNPKLTRITRNLAVDGNFAQGGQWGAADATRRKYGITPLGAGWYMRETGGSWEVYQDFFLVPGQAYSMGCWTRKAAGIGNGGRPRIGISHFGFSMASTLATNDIYGIDSAEWHWITGTFTVPAGARLARIYLMSQGITGLTANASDFAGFVLIPGSTPPGPPPTFPGRQTNTLQVTAELNATDLVSAISDIDARDVSMNGTRINSQASPQFLGEGMPLPPGLSTMQLESAASSGLWKATIKYTPRYD